jgi:multidrug efflux pump subunit AcrB
LASLAEIRLDSEVAVIPRIDGRRVDEVKAYLVAGTLPSVALEDFERRLEESEFVLPAGFSISYGGEAEKRNEAVDNLVASGVVLGSLIIVTLVLSFQSFRVALIIATVGGLSIGLGAGSLAYFSYPFGFMAIVGTMGLVGIAINDAIVVMAGIRSDPLARGGDVKALCRVVVGCTRHVVATSLTTIAGFTPLVLDGGDFWPPLAITIAGGVGGATLLALFLVPSLYLLLRCHRGKGHFWAFSAFGPVQDGSAGEIV